MISSGVLMKNPTSFLGGWDFMIKALKRFF